MCLTDQLIFSMYIIDFLDRAASLERAAHLTLCLVQDLHAAQDYISAWTTSGAEAQSKGTNNNNPLQLPSMRTPSRAQDNEFAQFLLKLAPRIRTLESKTVNALGALLGELLQKFPSSEVNGGSDAPSSTEDNLLILGHCMRGLALLGRGKEVESIFARTAVMPLIRSLISMGRLDQGGSRGECAGLVSLLEEIATKIRELYGPVLALAETTFCAAGPSSNSVDVDVLTEGVWVPIATALMADAGIKMAIFSPGIASILQANYLALDHFLADLALRLLNPSQISKHKEGIYYQPEITPSQIERAQDRIYAHAKTAEFIKRWNLPIYYQLRFGESCNRLNKAVDQTRREGWVAEVFTGESNEYIREKIGLELAFFQELFDILSGLWRSDVILSPLTNRFLRGSVQLVGRSVSFVSESMQGKIKFGEEPPPPQESNGDVSHPEDSTDGDNILASPPTPKLPTRPPYCWGDSQEEVAAVAWELTVLESALMHEYIDTICSSLESFEDDLRPLVVEVLKEATQQIHPVIDKAWNEIIVNILTKKCSSPLAAVKGVAATYRMTNRPPPTQASHWVVTILRPLQEFCQQFTNRIPERIGSRWKQQVVVTVSDRYAAAVKELLTTVERTENALRTRRAATRRQTSGSTLSDGEKVKLQVYLDYQAYRQSVIEAGIDPATVIGLSQLEELTQEGVELQQRVTSSGL